MNEILDLTPGLQCCLRCGRTLTDRALHDSLEEPLLASIRAGHADEVSPNEVCQPCVEEYRSLLKDRETRSLRVDETAEARRPSFLSRWFERRASGAQVFEKI